MTEMKMVGGIVSTTVQRVLCIPISIPRTFSSRGTSINNIHAGIYAGAELDAVSLQFNALQTWHGISSRRDVSFGGLNETLTADYGAQTSLLFGEAGYTFDLGAVELQPFGSLAYSLGHTNAYAEAGGASALTVAASSQQSVATVLGLRPEMAFAVDDKLLTVRGMVGWQHQAGEVPSGQYSLAGSAQFTVTGSSLANNATKRDLISM